MEANDIPPQFPQILNGGAKGRILGLRQDFWWRDLQRGIQTQGLIALEGLRPSLALIRDNAETEALGDEL
ncbi:hypothetical protein GSI_08358 [Ganoderma sinense ZZ0214-1]|uniref:Uncharacterized protein n=1 Tax=Ganoderma sinense ZZ0214-1 TaxID=1077348 RepID=A0A2G8S6Z5_9APHY|nr:hypothetical protein GSI_08358 [Ganoderma sinense ZZ0214-1]